MVKLFCKLIQVTFRAMTAMCILMALLSTAWVAYRGSRPMSIPQAPAGITYWQFMADRLQAAREVRPARCGPGMFSFFLAAGPLYSAVYTYVGMRPESTLARHTQPDSNIPTGVAGAQWSEAPGIWWTVVERISWSTLMHQGPGCKMRSVNFPLGKP